MTDYRNRVFVILCLCTCFTVLSDAAAAGELPPPPTV